MRESCPPAASGNQHSFDHVLGWFPMPFHQTECAVKTTMDALSWQLAETSTEEELSWM